jgi:RNA polymerase sigma-70 factor (ECF subfamily)
MLGSFDEAEDALQDALERAWKARGSFAGGEGLRAWLYKIATNVCLDSLRAKQRRPPAQGEVPWLQPYPDRLLDEVAPTEQEPDAVVVARETIELTYIALIQLLPARQRAVLVLRDVLEWSAAETAEILDLSVASANSALRRGRATLGRHRRPRRDDWHAPTDTSPGELDVVRRFVAAAERYDVDAMVALAATDIHMSAPPDPRTWDGRATIAAEARARLRSRRARVLRCLATPTVSRRSRPTCGHGAATVTIRSRWACSPSSTASWPRSPRSRPSPSSVRPPRAPGARLRR